MRVVKVTIVRSVNKRDLAYYVNDALANGWKRNGKAFLEEDMYHCQMITKEVAR